ncbi:MAG: nitroreductase family protein [Erysipelotrichaceae bacterium]|nr:nitroreductase family protein [Erysipelotrichaceae bacterium]
MELQECLIKRRSIRQYTNQSVSNEIIESLIQAAIYAPSWKNSQVSRYYVLNEKAKIKQFMQYFPSFNQESLKDAPVLIISTVVKGRSGYNRQGEAETHLGHGWQCFDNGLQVQNICLKATELGLGSLIVGIYDEKGIRDYLQIPDTEDLMAIIAIGYYNETVEMPKRKSVSDILTYK